MDKKVFLETLEILKEKIRSSEGNLVEQKRAIQELEKLLEENKDLLMDGNTMTRPMADKILRQIYIVESAPNLDKNVAVNYSESMSEEEKINYIAQQTRLALSNPNLNGRGLEYDMENDCLIGECITSTKIVVEECKQKEIKAIGYNVYRDLGITETGHAFAIVVIHGKEYLVDCTYRQFFTFQNNYDSSVVRYPGRYMLIDEKRGWVAEKILRDGWIEATPENIKAYLDGFVMADRKSCEPTDIEYEEYLHIMQEHPGQFNSDIRMKSDIDTRDSETRYILESTPILYPEMNVEEYNAGMSAEEKLRLIIERERRKLAESKDKNDRKCDVLNDNLRGDCIASSDSIYNYCYSKNIPATRFHTVSALGIDRNLGHFFNIIEIDGKNYLVDCTYRQFFSETYNMPKGIDEFHDPGMYMKMSDGRKFVAEKILRDGWIEATPENIKAYLDGFVMANNRSKEPTGITYEDYASQLVEKGVMDKSNITGSDFARLERNENLTTSELEEVESIFGPSLIVKREKSEWIIDD